MDDRITITWKQIWEGKQLYGRFKRLKNNISHDKTWTWLRKGNFKWEKESLLIATQNNAVRTNHIKARIDKMQQNSKCRLCSERRNHPSHKSECRKLAQKEYKARHDWVGKVIHGEMCKKFKFDHTNKSYIHNPAAVLENNTNKLLWDWHIDGSRYLAQKTRPNENQQKKKKEFAKLPTLLSPLTTE